MKIFNTHSGKKEEFIPINPEHIKIYACGPTVYNYAHIGNARMAVVFDMLVRVLRDIYPKVTYVSNITDIDDKIIDAANHLKVPIEEITNKYTNIYNDDMSKLLVKAPDIQPKATEYIPEMIALINDLIEKNHAYEKEGHVLFHVPSYENYGSLSKRNREEQIAGSRVEIAPFKKDPADFVLWKPSNENQPGWDSPWGYGRPGWHTECSAMSEKTLGLPFDIHGGGRDLTFPHHENEIAQSCCSSADINNPKSYVNYWMHNGFVTVNGEKMSKSLDNISLIKDLTDSNHGEVVRLALLSSHYRQALDWNEKVIHQSRVLLDKLYNLFNQIKEIEPSKDSSLSDEFISPLLDDLNTPGLIAHLNKMIKDFHSISKNELPLFKTNLIRATNLIGVCQSSHEDWLSVKNENLDTQKINKLIAERLEAKKIKDFDRADQIRQELLDMNIEIKDNQQGTDWSVKS
jgi:cysteinyl-tRNA synthetase